MVSVAPAKRPHEARWFALIVVVSAALYAGLLFSSAAKETQTNDESAHIAAGYSYWLRHDFRLNPEHPPLSKLLCTLPLLFLRPGFPDDPAAWDQADQFQLGEELLYRSSVPVERILLACRSVNILFTTVFVVFVAFWTRSTLSAPAALLVFFLLLLDPNIAAHARYVTSDTFVSAFFFLTCAFWFLWLRDNRRKYLYLTGATLGLALASKFSAVLLVPALLLMWGVHRWRSPLQTSGRTAASPLRLTSALVLIPAAILIAVYFGDTRSVSEDPLVKSRLDGKAQAVAAWQTVPVPAYYWLRGLQLVYRHQHSGHPVPAYLSGEFSMSGFVGYFPTAILVKTPTGTLLFTAILLALPLLPPFRRAAGFSLSAAFSVPLVLYLVVAMFSRIDIGIRHILLLYPLGYLILAERLQTFPARRALQAIAVAAVFTNLAEFVRVYPHPIAFFNTLSGGPVAGPHYLLDSNIDWGQGLIHLRDELALRPHSCLALDYFGRANKAYYFPGFHTVPGTLAEAKSQPCLIAVSVQQLYGDPDHRLAYLLAFPPVARPGFAIYLYDPAHL